MLLLLLAVVTANIRLPELQGVAAMGAFFFLYILVTPAPGVLTGVLG